VPVKYVWKTWGYMQGTCLFLKQSVHLLDTSVVTVSNTWTLNLTIQVTMKDGGPSEAGTG